MKGMKLNAAQVDLFNADVNKYQHSAPVCGHVTALHQMQETDLNAPHHPPPVGAISKRAALGYVSTLFFFLLLGKTGAAVVLVYRAAVVSGLTQTAPSLGERRVFNGVTFITSPLLSH